MLEEDDPGERVTGAVTNINITTISDLLHNMPFRVESASNRSDHDCLFFYLT